MKVKTCFKLIAGAVLLSSFTTANAGILDRLLGDPCPPVNMIRQMPFVYAIGNEGEWRLYSSAFDYKGRSWNVRFDVSLPEARDPGSAIRLGQDYFDHSPLLPKAKYRPFPHSIECDYDPGFGYEVYANSPAKF